MIEANVVMLRSGTVRYGIALDRVRSGPRLPVLIESPEAIGRLVASLIAAFPGTCELRISTHDAVLYVLVDADVPLERIDQRASDVMAAWEATVP